jgi:hypothetical protein
MGAIVRADTAALHLQLAELERREQEISKLRRRLHDRLDSFPNDALRQRERLVSAERQALLREIDALRERLNIR